MGQSTNGQICYGVAFDEGFEFPWGDKCIDDWWIEDVLQFKHSFELFDSEGEWLNGVEAPKELVSKYYDEKRAFAAANPTIDYELVNTCSGDYPLYVLAIKRTCLCANRGCPEIFNPSDLTVTLEEIQSLLDFCTKHGIVCDSKPAWYLSSYWG